MSFGKCPKCGSMVEFKNLIPQCPICKIMKSWWIIPEKGLKFIACQTWAHGHNILFWRAKRAKRLLDRKDITWMPFI